jgi:hypothetical protein
MMSSLVEAIERLYAAFADVPKPRQIDACPHCINEEEIRTLLDTPLRKLSPDELSPYASSVFLTAGSEADFFYFLPRILEIETIGATWYPCPELIGRAIGTSQPKAWPAPRRDSLILFLTELIKHVVESHEYDRIDEWMCGIAKMGLDVRPYLGLIAKSKAAVLAYFDDNAKCLGDRRLCNSFWEIPCAGHDAIVEWFYSDPVRWIPLEEYGCSLLV